MIERELEDYRHPPELRAGPFGDALRHAHRQVFRSLVQVNLYPRERARADGATSGRRRI